MHTANLTTELSKLTFMKSFPFILLLVVLFSGCQKELSLENTPDDIDEPGNYLTDYTTIKVYVDHEMPEDWIEPINEAIASWNDLQLRPHFELADAITYDTHIFAADREESMLAYADFPTETKKPGKYIVVNRNRVLSREGKTSIIRHELGHILGIEHVTSRTSIMNPLPEDGMTFTEEDIIWLKSLF